LGSRIHILVEKAVKIYHFLDEEPDFTKFLERITTGLKRTRPNTTGSSLSSVDKVFVMMAVLTFVLTKGFGCYEG
jgi:hypothetical protein